MRLYRWLTGLATTFEPEKFRARGFKLEGGNVYTVVQE